MIQVKNDAIGFLSLDRKRFRVVEKLSVRSDEDGLIGQHYGMEIVLSDGFANPVARLTLRASKVSQISIAGCDHWAGGVLLGIKDIADGQLEDVRFEFRDDENDCFFFCCSAFEAVVNEN